MSGNPQSTGRSYIVVRRHRKIRELVPMAFRARAILAALIALATWPAQGQTPFPSYAVRPSCDHRNPHALVSNAWLASRRFGDGSASGFPHAIHPLTEITFPVRKAKAHNFFQRRQHVGRHAIRRAWASCSSVISETRRSRGLPRYG